MPRSVIARMIPARHVHDPFDRHAWRPGHFDDWTAHSAVRIRLRVPEGVPCPVSAVCSHPTTVVRAHCDLPCGVYDPEQARIEAESVFRIQEKYQGNEDPVYRARAIHIKEERADLVKEHLDVLWHDYFKPEHLDAVPNLHELFWNANKAASKAKASVDPATARRCLSRSTRSMPRGRRRAERKRRASPGARAESAP